jgi:hypothetical protein
LRLRGFTFGDVLAPPTVEDFEATEEDIWVLSAGAQFLFDQRKVGPDKLQIVHTLPCYRK